MEIKQTAGNGTAILVLKKYEELTNEERQALRIPATNTIEDYANFYVNRKKDGSLVRVWSKGFSDKMNAEIEYREKYEVDLLDTLTVKLGHGNSKAAKAAKKRIAKVVENRKELK